MYNFLNQAFFETNEQKELEMKISSLNCILDGTVKFIFDKSINKKFENCFKSFETRFKVKDETNFDEYIEKIKDIRSIIDYLDSTSDDDKIENLTKMFQDKSRNSLNSLLNLNQQNQKEKKDVSTVGISYFTPVSGYVWTTFISLFTNLNKMITGRKRKETEISNLKSKLKADCEVVKTKLESLKTIDLHKVLEKKLTDKNETNINTNLDQTKPTEHQGRYNRRHKI